MHTARIADLLQPYLPTPLSDSQLANISTYIDLLLRWNARINLTAVRDPEEMVTRHFGESFFAAHHLFPTVAAGESVTVADIGSGAGFPGLPLKIWAPQVHLTLIESNQKKATFLGEAARTLTLTDINVFPGRAQDYPNKSNVVTLRAVENFATILPVAAALLAPQGRLALLIGHSQFEGALALLPHFTNQEPIPIPNSESRLLAVAQRE